jgi:hypothetical protein
LQEIETIKNKIDELLAEGHDTKLDDGLGNCSITKERLNESRSAKSHRRGKITIEKVGKCGLVLGGDNGNWLLAVSGLICHKFRQDM